MKSDNKREYTKENILRNGTKENEEISPTPNSFVTTIEKPGMNKSGMEAKKNGF